MELSINISQDDAVFSLIEKERQRQIQGLELIASENFVSPGVLAAAGSVLTNKYAEGYPGKRYYGGCYIVDEVEELARTRACELYGADHANVQPHSGSNANFAAYQALMNPGDTLMAMSLAHGGHLTHGHKVNFSGKLYNIVHYGVEPETEILDMDKVEAMALETRPKVLLAGYSAYARVLDFERFRSIADKVGAIFMVDMAHFAGLAATGVHPNPCAFADVVTTTTHKTLRGPRGGMILCRKDYAKAVDKAVFPGNQGGPLMHIIAAKAVAFYEALQPDFKLYCQNIVANAKVLAQELSQQGARLVSGGTDNHLLLVDVRPYGVTGQQAEERLEQAFITCNKNAIPFDPNPPAVTSGIRLGTAALTTRGFGQAEISRVGTWIAQLLQASEGELSATIERVQKQVLELSSHYPLHQNQDGTKV